MELVGAIHNAGNLGCEPEAAISSVSSEASSGSDVGILWVRRRTRILGPGLESGQSESCWEWELELDELTSSVDIRTTGAVDLSPTGTLAAASGLTSSTWAEGFWRLPQCPFLYALQRGSFNSSWTGTLCPHPGSFRWAYIVEANLSIPSSSSSPDMPPFIL